MIGELYQDSAEVKRGIESAELGRVDEGVERSCALASGIGAKKQVILCPIETARSALSAALLSIPSRPSST